MPPIQFIMKREQKKLKDNIFYIDLTALTELELHSIYECRKKVNENITWNNEKENWKWINQIPDSSNFLTFIFNCKFRID